MNWELHLPQGEESFEFIKMIARYHFCVSCDKMNVKVNQISDALFRIKC